jgi:hypothetical protein
MREIEMNKALCGLMAVVAGFSQTNSTARFDMTVRDDFFAGFAGDSARFERGMKTCEQALAADSKDPGALVWHGGGVFFQSGQAFRKGDSTIGMELQQRGLKEMSDGVALAPDSLTTRVPRGAILIASARFMEDIYAKPLVETGVADFQKALELQTPNFASLAVHSRGELLGGLADGYRRLGNNEKSREYLERMVRDLPGSPYEKQARRWLADLSAIGKQEHFCLGCHAASAAR